MYWQSNYGLNFNPDSALDSSVMRSDQLDTILDF